ncbi:alpha/beta hydrolase [soil metagenome]
MTLDPHTQAYIDAAEALGDPPYHQMPTAEDARAAFRQVALARSGGGVAPGSPECSVEGIKLGELWCRVYRPLNRSVHEGPLPLVVFMHGGGWVIGGIDTHDVQARAFAALPAIVVSVEYRMAPEDPYPAAHEDCWTWLNWAWEGLGDWAHADRLVVAGDSAGGLLAASMAQRCRDTEGGPQLAAQCLVYPAMNVAMDTPSHEANAEGYMLPRDTMRWFYDCYAPGEGFSPTELEDLSGMPPTVIATAAYDPLADDGIDYGNRLRAAGVPTVNVHFDGLIHGFFGMGGVSPAAHAAVGATVGALRGMLGR